MIQDIVRLLSAPSDRGFAYRVDLRLRPEGQRGPLARSLASTLSYYDTRGRTWERQALIKLRPVAGDPALGREFIASIEPFVYRKYFSFAEINEVKALKRQMEQRAGRPRGGSTGEDRAAAAWVSPTDIKIGRGGIRDIEYTVQFLQLLNGGDLPAVRQRNTLMALEALEIAGCLTPQETYTLADAYRFLRKTEHRLQLLFDLQTHKLPSSTDELRKLALRMGYVPVTPPRSHAGEEALRREQIEEHFEHSDGTVEPRTGVSSSPQRRSKLDEMAAPTLDLRSLLTEPLDQFLKDLHDKTAIDRAVLNHLLHQSFPDAGGDTEPESDLILDPDPDDATIRSVLGKYPFRDVRKAYHNLIQLARESVPFLSDRRCRHFFASIAPQLLRAVAETPNPDEALTNLERVSASLGAKAVLWELFSVNPPSLKLYVDLCAGSPFLSGILINNPGMADELLDSLVLNRPRTFEDLRGELAELCRGASDPTPILHSFQDKEFLRIGVGDLLTKVSIRETTAALSDLADAIANQVIDLVELEARTRWGIPSLGCKADQSSIPVCRYALLGLGKLGGREISYHSDLDLLLIYEADGRTHGCPKDTANLHYFTDLTQRFIKCMSAMGPMGRLYAIDMRLRPTGKSGSLVVSAAEFERYFSSGNAQLWERQMLTRARVIRGDPDFASTVMARVRTAYTEKFCDERMVAEIRTMREKLEATAGPRSLKRGPGGIVDVEFLVQLLQLQHGREHPDICRANIWESLEALEKAGILSTADAKTLGEGYSFLRLVEARLRVVTDRPLNEVPEGSEHLAKLARRLGIESVTADGFLAELKRVTGGIRLLFNRLLDSYS